MLHTALRDTVHHQMLANRRVTDGHQYTVPSASAYPYQWLWDSCFHAIILTHFSVADAKKELHSLTVKQWDNGMIPHMHYWEPHPSVMKVDWGVPDTSALTQPPFLAYAVWRIYEKDGDTQFLRDMFPAIERFHEYLLTRRLSGHKLIGIVNPDESGEDNSPRFDEALTLLPQHHVSLHSKKRFALFDTHRQCNYEPRCSSEHFWSEDVPFNTIMVLNTRILADIAELLGEPQKARHWRNEADTIARAMRNTLWQDGAFVSVYGVAETPAKAVTWARFAPLLAGLYDEAEAKALIETELLNQATFWSKYPVPMVSLKDLAFDANEPDWGHAWQHPHWRGPVWMASNWMLYHGLKRYGADEAATHIRTQSLRLLEQHGLREYFHPETGVGMGAQGFTWGGLVLDMQ